MMYVIIGHFATKTSVETYAPKVFYSEDDAVKSFRDYVLYICGYFKVPFHKESFDNRTYLHEDSDYSLIIVMRKTSIQDKQ